MDALKVSVSGIVAGLNEGLEACLHESANAAAENSLLTEEVSLGLSSECSLENACSCAADTESVCKTDILSVACSILLNSDKAGNTLACLVLTSYSVSGALGSDHDNVNVLGGNDAAEVNVEAVCKSKCLACSHIRSDVALINISLLLIGDKDHNDVGNLSSLAYRKYLKSLSLSLSLALGAFVKTYNNVYAAVLEVKGMSMSLRAVTNDSNGLAVESAQVTVRLIENLISHFKIPPIEIMDI